MERLEILANGAQVTDISALLPENSDGYNQLRHALEREFRHNGAPEVTKMNFDRVNFDPGTGKGSFRILLYINYTFGCEDLLVSKKAQTSEWTFEINGNTIIFYSSPLAEGRSTADEF